MASSPVRIKIPYTVTKKASKTASQCSSQKPGAEYEVHFGRGTWFATPVKTSVKTPSKTVQKVEARPKSEARPKPDSGSAVSGWWKVFGFDRQTGFARQLPSGQRSEARRTEARASVRSAQLPAQQRSAAEELGLNTSSKPTREQVKVAFRAKALEVHPDRGGTSEDFRRAVAARDVLLRAAA